MSTMMALPARSTLAELAKLARRFRCYDVRSDRFRDVIEVNEARARREASLALGCCESRIRVEAVAGLQTLGVA